jgi:hypothetical protein
MNSGIPFIKIADRVEVSVALQGHKVSGPPLVFEELLGRNTTRLPRLGL